MSTSAPPPTAIPAARNPSALERWMNGREKTLYSAMHNVAAAMMRSPRHAPAGASRRPAASAIGDAQHGHRNPGCLARAQRLDPEHAAGDHCHQRQRRQRERAARDRREAQRNIVEHEEHAVEGEAEPGNGWPVRARRPAHGQEQDQRQQADRAAAEADRGQREGVRGDDEIAGRHGGAGAQAARDDRDADAPRLVHRHCSRRAKRWINAAPAADDQLRGR